MSKTSMLVRVNKKVWGKARESLPDETDPQISKILYETSAIKLDRALGEFLYGSRKKKQKR